MSKELPVRPDLNQLKAQAKELLRSLRAGSEPARARFDNYKLISPERSPTLADAQLVLAREYGFASWRELRAHVGILGDEAPSPLEEAIFDEDIPALEALVRSDPELVRTPCNWKRRKQPFKPLTYACNFRRLRSAECLLRLGADAAEDDNYPLFRVGLFEGQNALRELLLKNGADVNAIGRSFDGTQWGPIVLGCCETLAADALQWFISNDADVDFFYTRRNGDVMNCADMVIKSYDRNPAARAACLRLLAQARTQIPDTPFIALLARDYDRLETRLRQDPKLLERRWSGAELLPSPLWFDPDTEFTPIEGATLLHIAIEYHDLEAASWLLEKGADVNARAAYLQDGSGGHTPLFNAAIASATSEGGSRARVQFLLDHGADPTLRANPRHRKMYGIDRYAGTIEQSVTPREWAERYEHAAAWISVNSLPLLRSCDCRGAPP